jgi:hypothetical protein
MGMGYTQAHRLTCACPPSRAGTNLSRPLPRGHQLVAPPPLPAPTHPPTHPHLRRILHPPRQCRGAAVVAGVDLHSPAAAGPPVAHVMLPAPAQRWTPAAAASCAPGRTSVQPPRAPPPRPWSLHPCPHPAPLNPHKGPLAPCLHPPVAAASDDPPPPGPLPAPTCSHSEPPPRVPAWSSPALRTQGRRCTGPYGGSRGLHRRLQAQTLSRPRPQGPAPQGPGPRVLHLKAQAPEGPGPRVLYTHLAAHTRG